MTIFFSVYIYAHTLMSKYTNKLLSLWIYAHDVKVARLIPKQKLMDLFFYGTVSIVRGKHISLETTIWASALLVKVSFRVPITKSDKIMC